LFEAGTRVPFITYWKGNIEPFTSNALVSQIDIFASVAQLVGSQERAQDSEQLLDVFLGNSQQGREELILEATSRTALRKGDWVMIPPYDGPAVAAQVNIELGNSEEYQLYNLKSDIGEQKNLAESDPDKLKEMIDLYLKIRGTGSDKIEQLELK
jgi:arylsulfatase A-like enzyme